MSKNEKRICVVLARSGSKRLQNKNQQEINNKSLIDYALYCCTENKLQVILSSDSNEILNVYSDREFLLHKRSKESSSDQASSEIALLEVLNFYTINPEIEVVLVPPTNPLRTAADLKNFLNVWDTEAKPKGYDQAISVQAMKNDFWYFEANKLKRVRDQIFKIIESRQSANRKEIFLETSALYVTTARLLYEGKSLIGSNPFPIQLSRFSALDIDYEDDLFIARKLMN